LMGRGSQALDIQEEWLWQSRAYWTRRSDHAERIWSIWSRAHIACHQHEHLFWIREDVGRPLDWVSMVGSASRSLLRTLVSRCWQEKQRLLVPHSEIAHVWTRRAKALIAFLLPTQGEPLPPLIFPCPKKIAESFSLRDPHISFQNQ
jgi:hypothetical protein